MRAFLLMRTEGIDRLWSPRASPSPRSISLSVRCPLTNRSRAPVEVVVAAACRWPECKVREAGGALLV